MRLNPKQFYIFEGIVNTPEYILKHHDHAISIVKRDGVIWVPCHHVKEYSLLMRNEFKNEGGQCWQFNPKHKEKFSINRLRIISNYEAQRIAQAIIEKGLFIESEKILTNK